MRRLTPQIGNLTLTDLTVTLPPEAVSERPPAREGRAPARGVAPETVRPGAAKPADPKAAEPRTGDPLAVTITPPPERRVALREASLTFGPPSDGVPSSSRLTLSGLSLPADLLAGQPIVGMLPAYGYRTVDLDVVADAAADAKARDLTVRDITISGRDIGTVRLSGTMGGIGRSFCPALSRPQRC